MPNYNQADLLAGVLDSSLDGIYAFKAERDETGRVVDFIFVVVNRAAEKLVGLSAEQLVGRRLLEMLPDNKADGLFDACVNAVETGKPFVTEHSYEHDGLANWYSISAVPYGDGFTVSFSDITKQKNATAALCLANERFELLVQGNASGVWDWDCKTNTVFYSSAFNEMLGYEPGGLGSTLEAFTSRLHPDDLDRIWKRVEDHLAKQGPYNVEYRLRHKDGHYVWCHAAGQAQWDEQRNPVRMAGSITNITKRVHAEQAWKDAVSKLNEAQQLAKIGSWEWTVADGIITWSDQIKRMFDMPIDQPAPSFEDHCKQIHPEDIAYWKSVLDKAAEDHQPYIMKFRNLLPNGESRVLESRGQCEMDEDGNLVRTYGTVQDITEMEHHRHRLEFALKASRSGLWDWRVGAEETYFSDTWYTMLGYAPGELPMCLQSWTDITDPDDLKRAMAALEDYFAGKTDRYTSEIRVKNKAGQWQWVLDVGEAVERDEDGRVTRMAGLHVDIDQQKRAQVELKQARDQAQQASAAKSAFVANMSHEIRTPMNAILGYADLLLDVGQTEADKRNHAQTINRNGKHLLSIINDILDLSKIEAGKMTIEHVTCSPAELFDDTISLMSPKADARGIELKFSRQGEIPPHIKSDPTRIRQVLINLLGNAIKFTEQGCVELAVRYEPLGNTLGLLYCDVIDTGIGIRSEHIENLFMPFSQADESTTRQFGGTGLGLNISSNLCTMLGGSLTCTSKLGEGSTFSAVFEVQAIEKGTAAKPKATPTAAGTIDPLNKRRILLVEDGPDNQRLFNHFLTKAGAEVTLLENGELGFDAAMKAWQNDEPFEVILMDMQMPVLDGYAATAKLRDQGYDLPIIALTAHASPSDRQKCLQFGCSDYLSKPVDRQKLVQLVADYLNPAYLGEGI